MSAEEIKVALGDSYMNVIRFGDGEKKFAVIAGVSLTGLEGQGEAIAEAYAAFGEEYTVYLFERKKHLEKGYTVEKMAEDVYLAMKKLGVGSAFVYGVSQGGMIAQVLAIKHPEAVEKLVLCSTACRPTETVKKVAFAWLDSARRHDVVSLNRSFFDVVYSKEYLDKARDILPELEKIGSPEDCDRFSILVEAIFSFDVADRLSEISCPVLVLGDKNDRTVGDEGSYELIERLGCENYMYDTYSHAVYDEAPDIKERIKAFLGGGHAGK